MNYFRILFAVLLSILAVIIVAAISPETPQATGIPHPEFKGMFVAPNNIDQAPHTRWLGYLYGITIILLFGTFLIIGNRKKGKVTSIGKWIGVAIVIYLIVFTLMVVSHWSYSDNDGGPFALMMPAPTAWMIYGVWFVPLIITIAYIFKFEEAIISDLEIEDFHKFIKENETKDQ